VRQAGAIHRHLEHVLLGVFDGLLDGQRHLTRLAVAGADGAVLIAHDDQRGEREAAPALDDLGDAIDVDDPLFELGTFSADSSHGLPISR